MSDTPDTDAERKRVSGDERNYPESYDVAIAAWEFAEKLERERAELREEMESEKRWAAQYKQERDKWADTAAQYSLEREHNACYAKQMEAERDELRAELERLKTTVETLASHVKSCVVSRNAHAINFRKSEVKRIEAERALAAMKGDAK